MTLTSAATAVLQFAGSLCMRLFGMKLMSDGIQKSAGAKLQAALNFMTRNRFLGLLTGLFITMLVQSSGATTVMVVSFVNAGLVTLEQSVAVIFGANIGTTITAWIVVLFGFDFHILWEVPRPRVHSGRFGCLLGCGAVGTVGIVLSVVATYSCHGGESNCNQ